MNENLSQKLREAYALRRRRDFPHYRMRDVDEVQFDKLANMLTEAGVDAIHYVNWAYDYYRVLRPVVYVDQIVSRKTLQIYRDKIPDTSKQVELEIFLQLDTLKTQLALGRDVRDIATDPYLELGSLFRYALARRARLPDLAKRFEDDANLMLQQHPKYQAFLTGFLAGTD